MKAITFKNILNSERFICDNIHAVEAIDGVEYLIVHRPNDYRVFKMRKDALEKIPQEKIKLNS
jgi:hypothetical protein